MIEQEYNLKINCDTTQLEKAVELAQEASRADFVSSASEYMDKAFEIAGDYKNGKNSIPTLENDVTNQTNRQLELSSLYAHAKSTQSREQAGLITAEQYAAEMQQIRAEANAQGYAITYGKSATDSNTTASELINNLQDFSGK